MDGELSWARLTLIVLSWHVFRWLVNEDKAVIL